MKQEGKQKKLKEKKKKKEEEERMKGKRNLPRCGHPAKLSC